MESLHNGHPGDRRNLAVAVVKRWSLVEPGGSTVDIHEDMPD